MPFGIGLVTHFLRKRRQYRKKSAKRSRRRVSDGADTASYLKQLVAASQPGATKKEFPYTIPPIETVIEMDKNTTNTIKTLGISIGAGIAIGGIAGAIGRIKSKSR